MSKIIQCTVGLVVTLAGFAVAFGLILIVASLPLWLIAASLSGCALFVVREQVCLLGETILTLAKAIWSKS